MEDLITSRLGRKIFTVVQVLNPLVYHSHVLTVLNVLSSLTHHYWSYIARPIAGQCIFISQCHQPNLYVNETVLLLGMGKLNDFSSYSYVYIYWSGP